MRKRKSFTVTLENKEKEDEYEMFLCAGKVRKSDAGVALGHVLWTNNLDCCMENDL